MSVTYIDLFEKKDVADVSCKLASNINLGCHKTDAIFLHKSDSDIDLLCHLSIIPIQTDIFGSFVYIGVSEQEKFAIISDNIQSIIISYLGTIKESFKISSPQCISNTNTKLLTASSQLKIIGACGIINSIPLSAGTEFSIDGSVNLSNVRFRLLEDVDDKYLGEMDNMTLNDLDYVEIG